jgi:hypothetical protein
MSIHLLFAFRILGAGFMICPSFRWIYGVHNGTF